DHFVHRGEGIGQFVNALELLSNVVCVQHRVFGGLPHSRTVSEDVSQRPNQHAKISAKGFYSANRIWPHRFERQPAAFFFHQNGHWPKRLKAFFASPPASRWPL